MRKFIAYLLLFVICIGAFLAFPFLTKDRSNPLESFKGPKLADLKFEEVEFVNNSDGTKLAGMLALPNSKGPFPVAIIIHGSGSSRRKNSWYLALTNGLLSRGIAVLLPDKRGSEKSAGKWEGRTIEELATDTLGAVEFIKLRKTGEFTDIGLIGVSQGGWIAPVAASNSQDLSFVVNLSGSVTNVEEQLLFEERNNIGRYTYDFIAGWIAPMSVENLKRNVKIAPLVSFDPVPFWKSLKTPSLIAYGENDTNCPVDLSLARLKSPEFEHIESKVYPNGKHAILNQSKTGISEDFLNDLGQFIKHSSQSKLHQR